MSDHYLGLSPHFVAALDVTSLLGGEQASTRQGPSLSIRIVILILPSDTVDDLYLICFDHPNRETAMLSSLAPKLILIPAITRTNQLCICRCIGIFVRDMHL